MAWNPCGNVPRALLLRRNKLSPCLLYTFGRGHANVLIVPQAHASWQFRIINRVTANYPRALRADQEHVFLDIFYAFTGGY
jgi:hypothetical protein